MWEWPSLFIVTISITEVGSMVNNFDMNKGFSKHCVESACILQWAETGVDAWLRGQSGTPFCLPSSTHEELSSDVHETFIRRTLGYHCATWWPGHFVDALCTKAPPERYQQYDLGNIGELRGSAQTGSRLNRVTNGPGPSQTAQEMGTAWTCGSWSILARALWALSRSSLQGQVRINRIGCINVLFQQLRCLRYGLPSTPNDAERDPGPHGHVRVQIETHWRFHNQVTYRKHGDDALPTKFEVVLDRGRPSLISW